jgi:hypothetical protein
VSARLLSPEMEQLPATRIPLKIYCEHSALSDELHALQRTGRIKLVGFPYDFPFSARAIASSAVVSDAQGRDLNTTWAELHGTWDDFKGSEHLKEILKIVGPANRRDVLHLDSAYKAGCAAMMTVDEDDILVHKHELETLLALRIFHPQKDKAELLHFIADAGV